MKLYKSIFFDQNNIVISQKMAGSPVIFDIGLLASIGAIKTNKAYFVEKREILGYSEIQNS